MPGEWLVCCCDRAVSSLRSPVFLMRGGVVRAASAQTAPGCVPIPQTDLSCCNCMSLMPIFCLFIFADTAQVDPILILNIQHSLTLDMRYYFCLP